MGGLALLAACATPLPPPPPPLPPPPPPPPPPVVIQEVIPYRPIPPGGADYMMIIPPIGPNGTRLTVNTDLDENETLWYFRSGWNVAALNCVDPSYQPILDGYGAFLKKYQRKLATTNTALDTAFRRENGNNRTAGIRARELLMTQVYNYFALPPARADFCAASLQIANEYLAAPPEDPVPFAMGGLQRMETVFQNFFTAYNQYLTDAAAWDVRYGAQYGASQPGYVAVHGLTGPSVAATLTDVNSAEITAEVVDPVTGARIPVIPVQEETIAAPVVQPLPTTPGQ